MKHWLCFTFVLQATLIFVPAISEARTEAKFFSHCDKAEELALGIMEDRNSGVTKDQAMIDAYQTLADSGVYEGEDFEFVLGIIRNAYAWEVLPDEGVVKSFLKFADGVGDVCRKKANGTSQDKPKGKTP